MKKLLWIVYLTAVLVSSYSLAFGQTPINYEITTLETRGLQDINRTRDLVSDIGGTSGSVNLLLRKSKYNKPIALNCPNRPAEETLPRRINNGQDVAGSCTTEATPTISSGFVRDKSGQFSFVNAPGADWTDVYALSDNGHVCGFYLTPLIPGHSGFERWHGFCRWDNGNYRTIDVPVANSVTVILGVNKHRQVVGAYFTYDPISEWTAFRWSNGIFDPLAYPNDGTWTYPLKIDNDGGILLMFDDVQDQGGFQSGPAEPEAVNTGYGVFEDGHFFRFVLPKTMNGLPTHFDVNGRNELGELTGDYTTWQCTSPSDPFCIITRKGFIATPR